MSWHYSRALVEAYLEGNSSDGERSAPWRSTNMPDMFSSHAKTTARSSRSRYGMTSELLTDAHGEELLTWFREASPAKMSASPVPDAGWTEYEAGYGRRWRELSVKYDLNTSSWKTHRCLFPGDSIKSLPTLPKWGLMQCGELWERTTPGLHTTGKGYGYWLTPDAGVGGSISAEKVTQYLKGEKRDSGATIQVRLEDQVKHPRLWPTPTASASRQSRPRNRPNGMRLDEAVIKFPTPTATAYKGWSPKHNRAESNDRIDYTIEREAHIQSIPGRLNPEWVEWLMGWPIGHTGLDPLATVRYREWWQWHGGF